MPMWNEALVFTAGAPVTKHGARALYCALVSD